MDTDRPRTPGNGRAAAAPSIAAVKASRYRIQRAAAELIGLLGLDEGGVVTGDAEVA
jgi:hypothetical protein